MDCTMFDIMSNQRSNSEKTSELMRMNPTKTSPLNITFYFIIWIVTLIAAAPQRASAQDDKKAIALFSEAAAAQNSGDYKQAIALWDTFVSDFPKSPRLMRAQFYLGVCYRQAAQYENAVASLQKVVKGMEENPKFALGEDTLLHLGGAYFSIAQKGGPKSESATASAGKAFNTIVETYPTGNYIDQALYFSGEAYYQLGESQKALKAYSEFVNKHPKSKLRASGLYALGVTYQESESYEQAEKVYTTFLNEFPSNQLANEIRLRKGETFLFRGLAAKKDGDAEVADSLLKKSETALQLLIDAGNIPAMDHALFQLATSAAARDDRQKALGAYERVAAIKDSSYAMDSKMAAGKILYQADKFNDAAKWLSDVADSNSKDAAEASHWLAKSYLNLGQIDAATRTAASAIAKNAKSDWLPDLRLDYADAIYVTDGKRKQALQEYRRIAETFPKHSVAPQSLYNAAYAALEEKEYKTAIELSDLFMKEYSTNDFAADTQYVRSESHLLSGDYEDAEKSYETLFKTTDQHPDLTVWRLRFALSIYLQKKYDKTISTLEPIADKLKEGPLRSEAEYMIGGSNFFVSKFKPAIQWLERSLKSDEKSANAEESLLLLARSYFQSGDQEKALSTITNLKKAYPSSSLTNQANYFHGVFAASSGDKSTAIREYDKVIAAGKSLFTPFAIHGKAWAQKQNDQFAKASETFTELIEFYPDHQLVPQALFGRGASKRIQDDFAGSIEDIKLCLEKAPDFADKKAAIYERGLAEVGLEKYAAAEKTFVSLLKDAKDSDPIDEYIYQLAWTYKSAKQADKSVENFAELAKRFPDSSFAAEANFHIGESYYNKEDFDSAAKAYMLAKAKADEKEILEKSAYKLGWTYFKRKDFKQAIENFQSQVTDHADGSMVADGMFMVAESHFSAGDFVKALEKFTSAKPFIEKSKTTPETVKQLSVLHAAISANESKRHNIALEFLTDFEERYAKSDLLAEIYLETGRAHRGLTNSEKAIEAFENAATESFGETGARARCLVGEVYFDAKKHEQAIKNYKRVIYGYGADKAPAEVKKWQALAGYEAGRCNFVRIKDETDQNKRAILIADAKTMYQYVVEKHPQSELAKQAAKDLKKLGG